MRWKRVKRRRKKEKTPHDLMFFTPATLEIFNAKKKTVRTADADLKVERFDSTLIVILSLGCAILGQILCILKKTKKKYSRTCIKWSPSGNG